MGVCVFVIVIQCEIWSLRTTISPGRCTFLKKKERVWTLRGFWWVSDYMLGALQFQEANRGWVFHGELFKNSRVAWPQLGFKKSWRSRSVFLFLFRSLCISTWLLENLCNWKENGRNLSNFYFFVSSFWFSRNEEQTSSDKRIFVFLVSKKRGTNLSLSQNFFSFLKFLGI